MNLPRPLFTIVAGFSPRVPFHVDACKASRLLLSAIQVECSGARRDGAARGELNWRRKGGARGQNGTLGGSAMLGGGEDYSSMMGSDEERGGTRSRDCVRFCA